MNPQNLNRNGRRKGTPNKRPMWFRDWLRDYCRSLGCPPEEFLAKFVAMSLEDILAKACGPRDEVYSATNVLKVWEMQLMVSKELLQYTEGKVKHVMLEDADGGPVGAAAASILAEALTRAYSDSARANGHGAARAGYLPAGG